MEDREERKKGRDGVEVKLEGFVPHSVGTG